MNMAIGYLGYKDECKIGVSEVLISGKTAGLKYDMGYDMEISKSTSFGFQVSYLIGTLTKN